MFSLISALHQSQCFYSITDLSSEVTVIGALDWVLFIETPPTIASREEKWSVVEKWWRIKTLSFSPSAVSVLPAEHG